MIVPPTQTLYAQLRAQLGPTHVQQNVPLAPYTTFKIGGPADFFFEAHTRDELVEAVRVARALNIPYFVLGLGANILVGDRGFRGLVIRNAARAYRLLPGHRLWAESGAIIYPDLIEIAVEAGLSGLEHYVGIPSTVGGALWQNLHFLSPERDRTIFIEEMLAEAEILTAEGTRQKVGPDYFRFAYDYSILHERDDIVLAATFQLAPGDSVRMRNVMATNLAWRRERHPPLETEPSAGSIFKKIDGIGAGRLIDQCGLKGTRLGDAEVSPKHANFIVNRGRATAAQVRALIAYVQQVVAARTGYRLEPEIRFIGEFEPFSDNDLLPGNVATYHSDG